MPVSTARDLLSISYGRTQGRTFSSQYDCIVKLVAINSHAKRRPCLFCVVARLNIYNTSTPLFLQRLIPRLKMWPPFPAPQDLPAHLAAAPDAEDAVSEFRMEDNTRQSFHSCGHCSLAHKDNIQTGNDLGGGHYGLESLLQLAVICCCYVFFRLHVAQQKQGLSATCLHAF